MPFYSSAPTSAAKSERTVHVTSTQSWTAPADATSVDILLVAGGGAGGGTNAGSNVRAGGGGGGGVIQTSLQVTPSTSYTITIGAGGSCVMNNNSPTGSGSNSTFGSLATCYGGQGGGSGSGIYPVGTFGSGGGPGQIQHGANGGGAAIVSTNLLVSSTSPNSSQSPWFSSAYLKDDSTRIVQGTLGSPGGYVGTPANPGLNGYGAGGGGSTISSLYGSAGGLNAGAGAVVAFSNGTSGAANYGGGGGGSTSNTTTAYTGGNGGSGICIIKYWSAL